MTLKDKTVLVTGATGFIGNRLVEVLGRQSVEMKALVHQFMNASRLARFPVRMYSGSITDRSAVARAMEGVDVVVHLAFGTQGSDQERRDATVEGTAAVCEAALRCGVSRVVHTSTFSVYGASAQPELDESAVRAKSGDVYADSKLEAENLVLDLHRRHGLPVVVLQPTIVYGPYAFWSRWPITQLQAGTVVLPDEGRGVCNAVYVDDVVNAIVRAASAPDVEGEVFLISGEQPCTWLDYYNGYAQMVPDAAVDLEAADSLRGHVYPPPPPRPTLPRLLKRGIGSPRLRQTVLSVPAARAVYDGIRAATPRVAWDRLREWSAPPRRAAGGRPRVYPLGPHLELFRSETRVRIDKAARLLGWQPQVSLPAGLERTRAWAKWFGLLGP